MSTHNIGFYEDLTKIIFELSSNIIKYAPYFFCCIILIFAQNRVWVAVLTRFHYLCYRAQIRKLYTSVNPLLYTSGF